MELSIEKLDPLTNKWESIDDTNTHIAPIQMIGSTFIQQLIASVGTTEVYNSGILYPYRSYITNELSYPGAVKQNFLASTGYYKEQKQNIRDDESFQKRCALFSNGKKVQLITRLDFDISNQELYLLNQIDVLFTLYRARDELLLHNLADPPAVGGAPPPRYRLYLHDTMKLYAKMIEVQPSLNVSIYNALERQPATYAVRKTEIKSQYISAGRTEFDYNAFSSTIPRRLTIALVAHAAFNGGLSLSPFNFQPFALRSVSVHAGGFIYPQVPYALDFKSGQSVRAYVDMYEALGVANTDRSFDITMDQFNNGWTFIVIPLTSTLDDSCGFELLRSGTTTLRLQFSEPIPTGGAELLVLGEFDQMVMIDYN
ncbi:MAG TPA: hypothetical protein VFV08_08055, partial [Puia sp.]|nr:hypothetical protein [Puia sp.]